MSSTFVADTSDDHKADNTLIIIVNNDGTVSVDQETLQNLLANQHNTPVSLVRLSGHSHGDDSSQDSNGTCDSQNDGNPHVNLTVEGFYPPAAVQPTPEVAVPPEPEPIVDPDPEPDPDPFLEMDSEQLKRLETALQSEQAKQILGENVTAMLDMLSVEDEASHLKDTIRMDHCYTSLTPASAPPAPPSQHTNNQYGNTNLGGGDGYSRDESKQQSSGVGIAAHPQQTLRGRGRGRGPGRPRKEGTVPRGGATTAYRGGAVAGRGGAIRVQRGGGSGGVVMMQQIKPITPLAPPPNSPSSASLVPLIRPLVLPAQTTTVQGIRTVQALSQSKVMTVPVSAGNTRFVTVAGKPVQVLDSSGQPRVFVATSQGTVQAQPLPNHVQVATKTMKQEVSSSDQKKPSQELGSPNIISGIHDLAQAKVVVARMPALTTQLMGAQTTNVTLGQSNATLQPKDTEADFTDFQQEETDESEDVSDEDADTDEDYKDSSSRRRSGRGGAKSRGGRFQRGGRGKGRGRAWDAGRIASRGGRQRGGRGRAVVRPEDADRAKKLELEMAAALAAMEKSPDREALAKQVNCEATPPECMEKKSLSVPEEPLCSPLVDSSTLSPVKKKTMKVYGRSVGKKNIVLANEEVHVQVGLDVPVNREEKERTPSSSTPSVCEKKSPTSKSPVRKLSADGSHNSPPSSVTPTTPTPPVAPANEIRKNYPKRENRKPPAHLADAFGPALFSTPDIIRRVSTSGEPKTPTSDCATQETRKENLKSDNDVKSPTTPSKLPEVETSKTSLEKEDEQPASSGMEEINTVEEVQLSKTDVNSEIPTESEPKTEVMPSDAENQVVITDTLDSTHADEMMEIPDATPTETEAVTSSIQVLPPQKVALNTESHKLLEEVPEVALSSPLQPEPVIEPPKVPVVTVSTRSARRRSSARQEIPGVSEAMYKRRKMAQKSRLHR